jgi:hypothetical protein
MREYLDGESKIPSNTPSIDPYHVHPPKTLAFTLGRIETLNADATYSLKQCLSETPLCHHAARPVSGALHQEQDLHCYTSFVMERLVFGPMSGPQNNALPTTKITMGQERWPRWR